MPSNHLLSSLSKAMPYIYYKGCNIEVTNGGYKIFGTVHPTACAAKQAVDNGYAAIAKSLRKSL